MFLSPANLIAQDNLSGHRTFALGALEIRAVLPEGDVKIDLLNKLSA
ncbi:MAG: hypothetical protein P4L26_01885 [Terracidiphilus sp.]|nr:hypothetical protein [Terracidiphilus sp.]